MLAEKEKNEGSVLKLREGGGRLPLSGFLGSFEVGPSLVQGLVGLV